MILYKEPIVIQR